MEMGLLLVLLGVCFVSDLVLLVVSAPSSLDKEDIKLAVDFMSRFGYVESQESSATESLIKLENAIKDVQRYGNIPQTGQLDNSTLQLMKSSRCGIPDVISSKAKTKNGSVTRVNIHRTRRKRYVLGPSLGWRKRHITYFISNWSPKIGLSAVRTEMQRALNAWAKYGRLKFQEVSSPNADIIVAFGSVDHGDVYPFDGPGRTLAHAFFPGEDNGGDIHFDNDESWKINPGPFEDGIDFFTVAVHELGHSLGLSHSPEVGSVMNPYYKLFDSNSFSLGDDDIMGLYELYIKNPAEDESETDDENQTDKEPKQKTTTTRRPNIRTTPRTITSRMTTRRPTTTMSTRRPITTTKKLHITYVGDDESVDVHKTHDNKHGIPNPVEPQTPDTPNGCEGRFSAVAFMRGELFIFKENYVWRLISPGHITPGYPVTIHRMFPKLPQTIQRIDAAYERNTDSNLILFSGDKYWVYDGNDFVDGSPRPIHDYGLPNRLKKIDGIMVWGKNKKTYIFSTNEIWRFNETLHKMDSGYPKEITRFKGVPSNIDSTMTWSDGITYFFKDNLYWAFNNTQLKTESLYPQDASKYWLGCR